MFAASKTASVSGGYQISRSLRFNSADSAYLNRTPASAGNKQTWTLSVWVKRGSLSAFNPIFSAGPVSPRASILFQSDNKLQVRQVDSTDTEVIKLVTTQVFRDPSAWYHIVVAQDTTQATSSNRVKIYVNGTQITAFDTATYPSQNISNLAINDALEHNYGRYVNSPSDGYLSAYLTETNFIDGQALTPSSFGETNAQTGVWQPKAYSGSYGTNGFYLNFSDNSNTTAATLGKDYSGNGNNWTPNNFSVTAGAGNDSLVDSPTSYGTDTGVGGTVRGNYSTLSPLYGGATGITNGNLDVTLSGGTQYGSMSLTTGKWYWEVTPTASLSGAYLGVMDSTFIKTDATWGTTTTSCYVNNGNKYGIGGTGAYGATYTTGDVIGFALDLDAGTMVFYKNGTSQGTASSGMTGREWRPMLYATGGTYACNFGQRPFAYTAPSGYKALCTQNLPTPTIGATSTTLAGKYFNPVLYTGNSGVNVVTGMGFQPDMLWNKTRSDAANNVIDDAVRGINKVLITNGTNAEITGTTYLSSFDADGFTLNTASPAFNYTGYTYVAWGWKANGSGSTNTAGSITSTVSANTTSGFSVVTYTGNGTSGATIGHGLGVAPAMLIVKSRSAAYGWCVYTASLGATYLLKLDTTAAATNSGVTEYWKNTAPTSSVFTIGNDLEVNANTKTFVAYCFAEVAGYSKFGSYTGNGSTDGPFVYCGFRPAFIMVKASSGGNAGSANWLILDNTRNTYNETNNKLAPNLSDTENSANIGTSSQNNYDFLSNGFKARTTNGSSNENGTTFIFMALAQNPFKYSLAR